MDAVTAARDAILGKGHLPDGFNIGVNAGEAAGQTVPHLHVHVIPRYRGDVADPRGGVRHVVSAKANYLEDHRVITGQKDHMLRQLYFSLDGARRADIAVAFVSLSGVRMVMPRLRELLERAGQLRVITGDYGNVTEPDALVALLDLAQEHHSCQLRVWQCEPSFHPKFYLFERQDGRLSAFVGSSNLTRQGLKGGVEWNYRVLSPSDAQGLGQLQDAFETLFSHPHTQPLTFEWIAEYRARRGRVNLLGGASLVADSPDPSPLGEVPLPLDEPVDEIKPHEIQEEALRALEETREEGYRTGLVVLATGLGKTWLAAFDSTRPEFGRVLFIAHREEILAQAFETFRRIRPDTRMGFYTGEEKAHLAEIVFASVQTLGRSRHLEVFGRDAFDYIVMDEFHHASAKTYRNVLDHFRPRFLLGLTATPERSDGGDLLALCDENLVYRCDFFEGIRRELLSPFHYFGVPDVIDYSNIPWRSARFDPEELEAAVITERRAQNALEQYRTRGGKRTLAFCCSMRHSDWMADFFRSHGLRVASVHSGPSSAPRAASLEQLRDGELDIVCCVDMFNEGTDIPAVDTILMLRPTESRVLWLQQIGRGLRRCEGKQHVAIIDYIGNHRSFLSKTATLLVADGPADLRRQLEEVASGRLPLPPGCQVTYDLEAVRILESMLPSVKPGSGEALKSYYREFEELHGVRPTAREAYHDSRLPASARKHFGSWLGFVQAQGGLSAEQAAAFEAHRKWVEDLEVTPMTKSYKMVVLEAMLALDRFPGSATLDELVPEVRRLAERTPVLRDDFGDNLERLPQLLEKYPLEVWAGTGYFRYADGVFASTLKAGEAEREGLRQITREILEWRLAQYLDRPRVANSSEIVCKVRHSNGKPILFIDRALAPELPEGWTSVRAGDAVYQANLVKVALNVMREEGGNENVLPRILRGWFGPNAGLPGTNFKVVLESAEGGWSMRPVGVIANAVS